MVRLRRAIWRGVLGTLIGSFNDGSIGAVAGILVWGTHMNAVKDRSRSGSRNLLRRPAGARHQIPGGLPSNLMLLSVRRDSSSTS